MFSIIPYMTTVSCILKKNALIIMLSIFLFRKTINWLKPLIHGHFSLRWATPCLTTLLLCTKFLTLPGQSQHVPFSRSLQCCYLCPENSLMSFRFASLLPCHSYLSPSGHGSLIAFLALFCFVLITTQCIYVFIGSFIHSFVFLLRTCTTEEEWLCLLC